MNKVTVIYWSGTGNTEIMAQAISSGADENGSEVVIKSVEDATLEDVLGADIVALGCPSMGDEVLEEGTMEPFVDSLAAQVKDKKMFLFGSYGWGSGEWMEDWEGRMKGYGVQLVKESLIINETPGDDDVETCKSIGRELANH